MARLTWNLNLAIFFNQNKKSKKNISTNLRSQSGDTS
jgi:hypothetical protein